MKDEGRVAVPRPATGYAVMLMKDRHKQARVLKGGIATLEEAVAAMGSDTQDRWVAYLCTPAEAQGLMKAPKVKPKKNGAPSAPEEGA